MAYAPVGVGDVRPRRGSGERELATERKKLPAVVTKPTQAASRPAQRNEREVRKEMKALERTIAQFDEQKRVLVAQSLEPTGAA